MTTQIAGMEEQRKTDHEAFLATKADDEDAVQLLQTAKEAISKFYEEKKESFLQQDPDFAVSEDQAPSSDFSGSHSRKGENKGVVSLMTFFNKTTVKETFVILSVESEVIRQTC